MAMDILYTGLQQGEEKGGVDAEDASSFYCKSDDRFAPGDAHRLWDFRALIGFQVTLAISPSAKTFWD